MIQLPFTWQPGEHVSLMGQTGSGKSTLLAQLLGVRQFSIVLRTKPDKVQYPGHLTIKTAAELKRVFNERVVLSPKYDDQKSQIKLAIEDVWKRGGFTIAVDELFYVTEKLKLEEPVERLLTQGRSKGISVVCGMQRPARISRFALSESTHTIAFFLEGRDRKLIKESVSEELADAVYGLERYQFAWWWKPERKLWVGRIQDLFPGQKIAI